MRITRGDIGRIRNDEIEALAFDRREPAAMAPFDLESERQGVALRHLQCCSARFHRHDSRGGTMLLESERDRTAAGAEVEHTGEFALERELDEQLALGSGNQHRGVYGERQAVELLAPEDVGHGLAAAPPLGKVHEFLFHPRWKGTLGESEDSG